VADLDTADKWRRFAAMDLNVAIHDTSFSPLPIEIVCYHCQQSAEKALKAILAYHEETILKTHDLKRLLDLCS
jgi:HEPN domain-containing protein